LTAPSSSPIADDKIVHRIKRNQNQNQNQNQDDGTVVSKLLIDD